MTAGGVDVDVGAVPRARTDVAAAILDGEAVVHHAGSLHLLDPVATLVWQCCDGNVTVGALGDELARTFGADRRAVRADVVEAIHELGSRGLVTVGSGPDVGARSDEGDTAAPAMDRRALVPALGSCAACDEPPPGGPGVTLELGDTLVRVATDDLRVEAALRRAFFAHLWSGGDPAPYYSLRLVERARSRAPQPLHLLMSGSTVCARSRSPRRVLRALVAHLATHADLTPAGLSVIRGSLVGDARGVVVTPRPEHEVILARELAARGLRTADVPGAVVDSRMEALVGAAPLTVDTGALDMLAEELPSLGAEPEPLPWGRYRIVALAVPEPATPAAALLRFGPQAEARGRTRSTDALLRMIAGVPVVQAATAPELAAVLDHASSPGRSA